MTCPACGSPLPHIVTVTGETVVDLRKEWLVDGELVTVELPIVLIQEKEFRLWHDDLKRPRRQPSEICSG